MLKYSIWMRLGFRKTDLYHTIDTDIESLLVFSAGTQFSDPFTEVLSIRAMILFKDLEPIDLVKVDLFVDQIIDHIKSFCSGEFSIHKL